MEFSLMEVRTEVAFPVEKLTWNHVSTLNHPYSGHKTKEELFSTVESSFPLASGSRVGER